MSCARWHELLRANDSAHLAVPAESCGVGTCPALVLAMNSMIDPTITMSFAEVVVRHLELDEVQRLACGASAADICYFDRPISEQEDLVIQAAARRSLAARSR